MGSFDSTKQSLYDILKDVNTGKVQLPDFQRGWVWDDTRIRGIIASVAKSYPIGAIMLLETGNDMIRFKTKPVEGVQSMNGFKPEYLLLDGQQRVTSLYQAIVTNRVVNTRNAKGYEIKRWYYIDMVKAMDDSTDLEEAIFSINESKILTEDIGRKVVLDLSTEESEFANLMFPVCMVDEYIAWRQKFYNYWKFEQQKMMFWNSFELEILQGFSNYHVPVIIMKKDNQKEAVCQVFEKVNTGGVSLTVFELLTATYASDDFDLKEDWEKIKVKFSKHKVLRNTSNTDIIQSITLLTTYEKRQSSLEENKPAVSAKRKDMLALTVEEYERYRDQIVDGYIKAAKILQENQMYNARDLPYSTQLVPMAAILAKLGNQIDTVGNKQKLMRWFWCGVFGELYGSAVETRYALDLTQVVDWISKGSDEPKTIYDANFVPSRLLTLRTRNSAAYKGVYALLLSNNTKDWLTATPIDFSTYFSEAIDIHHIFPVKWCQEKNVDWLQYDCIINKTPLSGRTNRIIGGEAPSKYLDRLRNKTGVTEDEFKSILSTHLVNQELMRKDDFLGFFEDRKEQILKRIERAMGKNITRDSSIAEEGNFVDDLTAAILAEDQDS